MTDRIVELSTDECDFIVGGVVGGGYLGSSGATPAPTDNRSGYLVAGH